MAEIAVRAVALAAHCVSLKIPLQESRMRESSQNTRPERKPWIRRGSVVLSFIAAFGVV